VKAQQAVHVLEKILGNDPGDFGSIDALMLVWAATLVMLIGLLLREAPKNRR
jgi:hypothetical protein